MGGNAPGNAPTKTLQAVHFVGQSLHATVGVNACQRVDQLAQGLAALADQIAVSNEIIEILALFGHERTEHERPV